MHERAAGEGLPVAPSLAPALALAHVEGRPASVDLRVVFISALAILVALAAGYVAELLGALIALVTNLAFYGRFAVSSASPAAHVRGAWVILIPALGGLIVGVMARFGAKAIRGHGIPEAMEQVLTNESRIPARMTLLKPLSAAIAIGTGGPFGAEGPIIATGGALGSLLGQVINTRAAERKTLLAAGAAAGMAATFGSPVSAVLLAIELLLFEYRPRSLIPVALAASTATCVRFAWAGGAPAFVMPTLPPPSGAAVAGYIAIGAVVGVASVLVTRAIYAVEDAFERLPVHWMWWPALGGLVVGAVGWVAPQTLGVGYDNIEGMLSGALVPTAAATLCAFKFVSWAISLGSGTSGGTLAPLFTLGGGLGAILGAGLSGLGVDPRMAALVGMAAMFAGASRALLASVVFAFETTRQPVGLLPLLGGGAAAFLVSCLLMKNSIMTEKIARRGVRALGEYEADYLDRVRLSAYTQRALVTLRADQALSEVRAWLTRGGPGTTHQGFPVLDDTGALVGVVARRELLSAEGLRVGELIRRAPVVVDEQQTLRDAADAMARERVGRLPIVARGRPHCLLGIITRSDLVEAHRPRLAQLR
ncbi:MAG TPA: chloride channel protein [Polyangiales bacterium]